MQPLRHFVLAVQFFSRIPVTGRLAAWAGWSPQLQHASVAHLPGVGWLVGAWGAACLTATGWLLAPSPWMPLVAAVLSTVATLWLTGGLHEDGLADVADGLGGFVPPERALEIMKDSRLGAYGAMALVMALLAKLSLVALLVERIAAAVAKDNKSLADAWNKAFKEALADGSYAKLSQKYFHEDIRCPD